MGCRADRILARTHPDAGLDAGNDEGRIERHWGEFASTVALEPCPDAGALVVNTVDDTLEGGTEISSLAAAGPTLSLREAFYLAANTPGAHVITFDPQVFVPGAAGVIRITDPTLHFPLVVDTCIEARGLGVIVDFDFAASCESSCIWSLGDGSKMRGMVIRGNSDRLRVGRAAVAANRFAVTSKAILAGEGAVIGPMNVFAHGAFGVQVDPYFVTAPVRARIEGNYFGAEPSGTQHTDLVVALVAFDDVEFSNNTAASSVQLTATGGSVHHNTIDAVSMQLAVSISGSGVQVGPSNVIRGDVANIRSAVDRPGNRFFDNTFEGHFFGDGARTNVTDAGMGALTGECPTDGTVEGYARNGRTWSPIGTALCVTGMPWRIDSSALTFGIEAATLFTEADGGHTGPLSDVVVLP